MNRPRIHNLNPGEKLRDTETTEVYEVVSVDTKTPNVEVVNVWHRAGSRRNLTATEFLRMEHA